jgi:hypothetical protein
VKRIDWNVVAMIALLAVACWDEWLESTERRHCVEHGGQPVQHFWHDECVMPRGKP